MMDELINNYKSLDFNNKRSILLDETLELCILIEKLCKNKGIDINKLKSSDILINKSKLNESEYLNSMFTYIIYLKEDLGLLLQDL